MLGIWKQYKTYYITLQDKTIQDILHWTMKSQGWDAK